jgi:hypothetical protein
MPEISPSRYVVTAAWDDVPHLTAETKAELLASTPPHLREARAHGIPSLGSGAVYPVAIEQVVCAPFAIPAYWPRAYALDVGWNRTAALWGAWDQETDTLYVYSEHYLGQNVPAVHAAAVQARGKWIRGVVDPAARGRSQIDGQQLLSSYVNLGLKLTPADNAVEAGIYDVWQRLETGRLKMFTSLTNLLAEYRMYRRDDNGKIIKKFDHLVDCLRYLCRSGRSVASVQKPQGVTSSGFMAADTTAGY